MEGLKHRSHDFLNAYSFNRLHRIFRLFYNVFNILLDDRQRYLVKKVLVSIIK